MLFACFCHLFITTIYISVALADTKLYCVAHSGGIHKVATCSSSKRQTISAAALTNAEAAPASNNKMTFDLTCKADSTTCAKVSATFSKATEIMSTVFQFETPLLINATFADFCQEYKDCNYDNKMTSIGQAYPSISYIMTDTTDNTTRMYPQTLLKQFTDLSVKPSWAKYDIDAQFNTRVDWYFVNDDQSIGPNQTDFLRNVLHELIHGLGLVTSWSDNLYRALNPLFNQTSLLKPFLTPMLLASTNNEQLLNGYSTPIPFWGFVEFPFDKFLTYNVSNVQHTFSETTTQLNHFGNSNSTFRTMVDMANDWYNSDAYNQAAGLYQKSVTPLEVLATVDGQKLWLESSLSPFAAGSSLCHVDQSTYLSSSEYLMVYTANHGIAISQLNQKFPTGPIGLKLQTVMGALGYRVNNAQTRRPTLTYWHPPHGLVGTESNPHPSLTINTNGPAHSPIVNSTYVSNPSSSPTAAATANASFFSSPCYLLLLLPCTIILFF